MGGGRVTCPRSPVRGQVIRRTPHRPDPPTGTLPDPAEARFVRPTTYGEKAFRTGVRIKNQLPMLVVHVF